jgi:hypothetical protein
MHLPRMHMSMLVKGPAVQTSCSNTFYRLLPMIYNSNQQHTIMEVQVGLGTEFRSEKIPRNRLGTVSVIPRKKVLFPRYSEFCGRANSEARNGTERKSAKK